MKVVKFNQKCPFACMIKKQCFFENLSGRLVQGYRAPSCVFGNARLFQKIQKSFSKILVYGCFKLAESPLVELTKDVKCNQYYKFVLLQFEQTIFLFVTTHITMEMLYIQTLNVFLNYIEYCEHKGIRLFSISCFRTL